MLLGVVWTARCRVERPLRIDPRLPVHPFLSGDMLFLSAASSAPVNGESNYLASESVSLFTPWRVAEHVPRLKTHRAARSIGGWGG